MIQLNSHYSERLRQIFAVIIPCLPIYLALEVIGRLLEASFEPAAAYFASLSQDSSEDSVVVLASFVALSTIWALVSGSLRLLVLRDHLPNLKFFAIKPSTLPKLTRLNLLMIETTRAMASVLFRVPLLFIPAVVRWFRLVPLPYLVLLSREYESGQIDALELTESFSRNWKGLTIFLALIPIVTFVPDLLLTPALEQHSSLLQDPVQHVGSILAGACIKLVSDTLLFFLVSRKLTDSMNIGRIEE